MKPNRPILRYHGGKWKLAPWILSYAPAHRVYTECYGGAASVLLQKERSYAEVYNDLDGDVVNLFRVVRDPAAAKDLQNALRLTPFAREEFRAAYEPAGDDIERARRLVVRSFMGFGSAAANSDHRTGFRSNSNRSGTTPAHDWANYPDSLTPIIERMRGVVIESRNAVDMLKHHDGPESLHYVDPPYLLSTRLIHGQSVYRHEMTDDQHRELSATLHDLKGMVILSGYHSALYDECYADWKRVERAAYADGAAPRTEVLWLNQATVAALEAQNSQINMFSD